jgi:hypothetical protein
MKTYLLSPTVVAFALLSLNVSAAVHYVDLNCTSPASPYTNWPTAATNIQDAVDAAADGDQIIVTNGVYQTGGRVVHGSLTNRVAVIRAVILQSVNGPAATIIQGYQVSGTTFGDSAVRCVYLTNGATLFGFTLTNGATRDTGDYETEQYGGGCWCEPTGVVVSNCIVTGNAGISAGGIYRGTLNNCVLAANTAADAGGGAFVSELNNCIVVSNSASSYGGGAEGVMRNCLIVGNSARYSAGASGSLFNCTLVGNTASFLGGAAYEAVLFNCIAYYNSAPTGPNTRYCSLEFCCTPDSGGPGNITNAPSFANPVGGDYHLNAASSCINAGSNALAAGSSDLDGNPRIVAGRVDMGAYEFTAPIRYVNLSNTAPASPYTNWPTAATNIQDAIDVADAGDYIAVSNGVYQTGGRTVNGYALTNRVVIDRAVTVQSVNGPAVTMIQGFPTAGNSAVRCVYLTNGAVLVGFTLTNGATQISGNFTNELSGAGAWCESIFATISNCVLVYNYAGEGGGGAYQGTLNNCAISNNAAYSYGGGTYLANLNNCIVSSNRMIKGWGGGVAYGILSNCLITRNFVPDYGDGGGIYCSTLNNCTVSNNIAYRGGGVAHGVAINSLISSNRATYGGGVYGGYSAGAYGCMLVNCTVVSNTASVAGGGVYSGGATNCIVYYNTAPGGINFSGTALSYCDTLPLAPGFGNITNAPVFVDLAAGNFRLQTNSPCINAGNNAYVTVTNDLDGNPRIRGGTVDMGAYEFQSPASIISYAWLRQYGLTNNGSADYADTDGDGVNNWQEWLADTSPVNANDYFHITSFTREGTYNLLQWTSKTTRLYHVERRETLDGASPWETIFTNAVLGLDNVEFDNTGPQYFYRIEAVQP